LDGISELVDFANKLEAASIKTIDDGVMTKDLADLSTIEEKKIVNTENFLREVNNRLAAML